MEKIEEFNLNPRYTFEEFIVGPNSRFVHAAALAVAENPGKVYNPLFIYGGVGLGKTHLMQAIGHYILKKKPDAKICYITSERFISEVIESIEKGKIQQFRDTYRNLDVLLVDDIQFLAESESTQEEFFHTFNILYQQNKQIVLTSDRPPKMLSTLEDRVRSRFEWGLIADIKSPSLETRVAILKKKIIPENLNLDDNILLYIASKLKSNIRELEGFLKRINAYATISNRPIDMELVKEIMHELLPEEVEESEEVKKQDITKKPEKTYSSQQPLPSQIPQQTQEVKVNIPQQPKKVQPPVIPKEMISSVTTTVIPKLEVDMSLPAVEVAFFYPYTKEQELIKVKEKFINVIKKHNLKFRLESIFDRSYDCYSTSKINYTMFTELCKTNKISIMIVLGPSPDATITNDEFLNTLSILSENESISLQYIPWNDLNKDYRYLNLALDITLTKHKFS